MLCLFSFKWGCPLALVCLAVPVQRLLLYLHQLMQCVRASVGLFHGNSPCWTHPALEQPSSTAEGCASTFAADAACGGILLALSCLHKMHPDMWRWQLNTDGGRCLSGGIAPCLA